MARKLFAMEDNEVVENLEQEESTLPEVMDEVAEVNSDLADTREKVTDVIETTDAVEEAMDASDQLEEVKEVVEQAEEEGGLDPVAAEAVRIAVSAIASRIGVSPESIAPSYAAENFQSKASRKGNTRLALEGISEFLSNLWKKIKEIIATVWNKLKSLFTSSKEKSKKAVEVSKKLSKVTDTADYSKEGTIVDAPSNVSSALPDKEEIKPEDIKELVENTVKTLGGKNDPTEVFNDLNKVRRGHVSNIKRHLKLEQLDTSELISYIDKVIDAFNDETNYTMEYPEEGYFSGGKVIICQKVKYKSSSNAVYRYTLETVKGLKKVDSAKLVLPSKTELKAVNDLTMKMAKLIDTYSERLVRGGDSKEEYEKDMDEVIKMLDSRSDLDEAAIKEIKPKLTLLMNLTSASHSAYAKFVSLQLNVCNDTLSLINNYVTFCLKQYKSK